MGKPITLCIRYILNPNKLADFKAYAKAEQGPIRKSGGEITGYYLPTDFAGATNEAMGLIEFSTLADYERYRRALADDRGHQENVARLQESGVIVSMNRFFMQRVEEGEE